MGHRMLRSFSCGASHFADLHSFSVAWIDRMTAPSDRGPRSGFDRLLGVSILVLRGAQIRCRGRSRAGTSTPERGGGLTSAGLGIPVPSTSTPGRGPAGSGAASATRGGWLSMGVRPLRPPLRRLPLPVRRRASAPHGLRSIRRHGILGPPGVANTGIIAFRHPGR
jgi:hypothetical protein